MELFVLEISDASVIYGSLGSIDGLAEFRHRLVVLSCRVPGVPLSSKSRRPCFAMDLHNEASLHHAQPTRRSNIRMPKYPLRQLIIGSYLRSPNGYRRVASLIPQPHLTFEPWNLVFSDPRNTLSPCCLAARFLSYPTQPVLNDGTTSSVSHEAIPTPRHAQVLRAALARAYL